MQYDFLNGIHIELLVHYNLKNLKKLLLLLLLLLEIKDVKQPCINLPALIYIGLGSLLHIKRELIHYS